MDSNGQLPVPVSAPDSGGLPDVDKIDIAQVEAPAKNLGFASRTVHADDGISAHRAVAPAMHVAVEVEAAFAAGFGRDHRRGAAGIEVRPDPVHIERLVAEQGVEIQTLDQRRHADGVVPLAGQQHEAHQIAECVDQGDDFGGQAAARASDSLGLGPPLAPLAF